MYRHIDRIRIDLTPNADEIRREADTYMRHRNVYNWIRKAYLKKKIDKDQLLTLHRMVKAGDVAGAVDGLARWSAI